jgi:hypothetical protein
LEIDDRFHVRSSGLIIITAIAVVAGLNFYNKWLKIFEMRNAPIVVGQVVQRAQVRVQGVPEVDFTIKVTGTPDVVHAHTGTYLLNRVPETVRFRYAGNPSKQVFLFEYERDPLWVLLFCWGVALLFIITLILRQRCGPADRQEITKPPAPA